MQKFFVLAKEGQLGALFSVIIKSRGTKCIAVQVESLAKRMQTGKEKIMGRKKQPLTLEFLIKEGNGALTPEKNEECLNQKGDAVAKVNETLQNSAFTTKRGRPKKRKNERFKKALTEILSMVIAPETVAEAVKKTPLGEKITYQEAILIAQVLKASNGDTQAAVFIRDTTGNKLKDNGEEEPKERTFESF